MARFAKKIVCITSISTSNCIFCQQPPQLQQNLNHQNHQQHPNHYHHQPGNALYLRESAISTINIGLVIILTHPQRTQGYVELVENAVRL